MKKVIIALMMLCLTIPSMAQISKAGREYVDYIVKTSNPDRKYNIAEPATVIVEAYMGGNPVDGVEVKYKAGEDWFASDETKTVMFKNGRAEIPLGTMMVPGFISCNLNFTLYGKNYKEQVKVAFEPERIVPLTPMPADFEAFWQKTMKATNKIDMNPKITPLPQYSTDKVDVFLVELTVGENGRNMFGYLSKPKDNKKHPVLFSPPGAGDQKRKPSTTYSERGYIFMNINIHSGCNSELSDSAYDEARKIAHEYNRNGIESKETFYYREVYAGCSRCVDFLCSLPEWDGKNVGVTGGSQGGALSITTAALNPKVTFCAAFYPALSDVLGYKHGRAGGWPKYFRNTEEKAGAEQTLAYYDVVNFARLIKCPVSYSFGYNDNTCPPTSTYAAYNVITAEKVLETTPTSAHWRFPDSNEKSIEWMQTKWK